MKLKTLVPFIVILALLLGWLAYQKMTEAPPAPIATQIGLEALVPESLMKNAIARIELFSGENPDEKVVLAKEDDTWRITSLYNAPVNQDALDGFIDKMLGLKGEPRATAATEERRAEFALTDEEAFHVQAYTSSANPPALHLLFGKSADFRTVFLRKAGADQVFVEATNLRREAGASDSGPDAAPKPTKWLQTTLMELDADDITRVALTYPDKEVVLERHEVEVPAPETPESDDEDGNEEEEALVTPETPETTYEWTLASGGFGETFNETELQSLLNRFANLTVTNAVDPEKKADWGFEPPEYAVTLSAEGREDIVLYGGRDKPGGDTYVQLAGLEPPLIYQISKFNFEQIFLQGSKLFTLPEWNVDEDEMARIEVRRPDGRVVLTRDGETWQVTEPELGLEVQKTAVDNLVSAVSALKPADYADPDANVGAFDISISVPVGEDAVRTLRLGQPSLYMDGRYARFDDDPAVLVLTRADVEKLTPPARDLYALSVLDFDVDNISQISVVRQNDVLLLERDGEDGFGWRRTLNEKTAEAPHNDVEEFVHALNDFQVDNFLLNRDPGAVQASTIVSVTQQDGVTVALGIADEQDDVHEATVSGLAYVFTVLPRELLQLSMEIESLADFPEEEAPEESLTSEETADEEAVDAPTPETAVDALVLPPLEEPDAGEADSQEDAVVVLPDTLGDGSAEGMVEVVLDEAVSVSADSTVETVEE